MIRLSQQVDNKQQVIASLRHELTAREELLRAAQQQLQSATSAQVRERRLFFDCRIL